MVPRKRGGEEALALARTAFGLSAELTRATPLPSYDDQNWLLHSADVPRYVLKIAAAYAECRGCADEAATYEQLQLENAAMRALFAGGVSVPRPLRAKTSEDVIRLPTPPPCAIGQRSRVAAAAPAAAQEPADADAEGGPADFGEGIALVAFEAHRLAEAARPPVAAASEVSARASDAVTGRPVVEFARLLTFELGEHLAVAEHTPELLHRLGVLIAQSAHALAARLGSQDVAVASARRLTWDLANASAARRYLPKVADASDRALAETYLSRFDGCARARARLPAQVLHGDLNDYNILVNSNILRRAQGAKGMGAGGAAGAAAAGRAAVCADDNGAGCVAEAAPAPRRAVGVGAGAGAALPISSAGLTVLDFGDIIYSARVFDLAIAIAYVCQNKPDGQSALRAACAVVRGYSAYAASQPGARPSRQLTRAELRVLHSCVCARLAQSVLNSAHAISEEPQNAAYLAINSAPGWALMRQWADLSPEEAEAAYVAAAAEGAGPQRRAFGLAGASLQAWLLPYELPTRRNMLLTGALIGAAAALFIAVGVSAVRVIARRGAG